jgi:hypothetical protein
MQRKVIGYIKIYTTSNSTEIIKEMCNIQQSYDNYIKKNKIHYEKNILSKNNATDTKK